MVLVQEMDCASFPGPSVKPLDPAALGGEQSDAFSRGPGKPAGSPWTGSGSEPTVELGPRSVQVELENAGNRNHQLGTIAVLEPRELESLRTTYE